MHLLIPFASALSERGTHTLRGLKLPHLSQLLARLSPTETLGSNETTLTPPHERAHAQALGWAGDDGCLPWAARSAAQDSIEPGLHAWGLLTPVHWHVSADHVSLPDPTVLHLSAQESHALFAAMRPLFESEGWALAWGAPQRWYAAHDSLAGLPCASIDRVIGRHVDAWLPTSPQAQLIRRLQNEVQMLLYQQPVNDKRVGQGALPVNSFWLSGCGRAQPEQASEPITCTEALRHAALNSDWAAWAQAWRDLDKTEVRAALERVKQGKPVTLTLCGERFAQRFELRKQGLWVGLSQRLSPPPIAPVLEAL